MPAFAKVWGIGTGIVTLLPGIVLVITALYGFVWWLTHGRDHDGGALGIAVFGLGGSLCLIVGSLSLSSGILVERYPAYSSIVQIGLGGIITSASIKYFQDRGSREAVVCIFWGFLGILYIGSGVSVLLSQR